MIGITAPPLEIGHNWRQVTGLMVARNYLEIDSNILYPRVDNNAGGSGIIGMEFPSLNYIYFYVAKIFGYTHWYGRLINLIISSLGLFFFSKIIRRFFSYKIAFASTLFLAGSIWFSFSRKMMPDTYCISLMLIGLYYGIKYLDQGKFINVSLYVLFSSLGILSKIPAGIYFALLIPLLIADFKRVRKNVIFIVTLIPILLTYLWYFMWNPYLSELYGNWYNIGVSIPKAYNEIISHFDLVLKNFYFNSFSSYILFVFFLMGLFQVFKHHNRFLIYAITAVFGFFVVYILKSGFIFYHHNYYIIPFVPIMALVAGYFVAHIKKHWIFVFCLFIGLAESILNQQHDFFIKDSEKYKLELETIADKVSTKNELIVINGNDNPQQIYLTHRKGWTCSNSQITDESFIKNIQKKGCRYIFINNHTYNQSINKKIVFANENYTVYDIAMP